MNVVPFCRAVKRDIAVTILLRCRCACVCVHACMRACVHACMRAYVRPDLSGSLLLHLCMDFKII